MLIRLPSLVLVILCAGRLTAAAEEEAPWTWAGLEILGNRGVSRAEIEKHLPIPIGQAWRQGDAPFWTEWCARVKETLDFASVACGDRPRRPAMSHSSPRSCSGSATGRPPSP